jgi:hypothetical protein
LGNRLLNYYYTYIVMTIVVKLTMITLSTTILSQHAHTHNRNLTGYDRRLHTSVIESGDSSVRHTPLLRPSVTLFNYDMCVWCVNTRVLNARFIDEWDAILLVISQRSDHHVF